MLIGTAVAVFLLVRPPGETKGSPPVVVGKTTATPSTGAPQPTVAPKTPQSTIDASSSTPASSTTPGTDETPETTPGADQTPSTNRTPGTSATESPFGKHVIESGDTLFDIAKANLPPGDNPVSFAQAIATLNGLDYDAPVLTIGKTLLLPKPKPSQ